ncbi:MAG: hypothetical protein RLY14_2444 [Planctomycetota bacterium]|jgi:hypothetical protein
MSKMDRLALVCGLVPLSSGIAVFLLWLGSRWEILKLAGVFVILAGIVCIFVGATAMVFSLKKSRVQGNPIRKHLPKWILLIAVFLSNFLAAGGIIATVLNIESRYTIRIVNQSNQELSAITISGGGCLIEVPNLPAGVTTTQHLYFKQDGSLTIKANADDRKLDVVIEGYITNGMGGFAKVTVNENKQILIEHPEK